MGLFEQYPVLLVPIIVLTVEGWLALKALARTALRRRGAAHPAAPRSRRIA